MENLFFHIPNVKNFPLFHIQSLFLLLFFSHLNTGR
nr:MAG TPA: hypothetical protein [Bacteriophage sp.]DAJ16878.1 MAG TPA: hypothetical protein [Caudovirales sp. ctMlE25]DAT14404.1 MAG TPA: hypothetical protein [Caudoviricetes sp.]